MEEQSDRKKRIRKPTTIKKQPKKNTKSTMDKRDQEGRSRMEMDKGHTQGHRGRDDDVMAPSKLST